MKSAKMIGILALVVVIAMAAVILLQIDDWSRDWTTNHARLETRTIEASPEEIVRRIQAWTDRERAWTFESADQLADETKIHLTRTTRLLRFTDDVRVRIQVVDPETPSRCNVDAESQSRVGKGDLGQNPRNLKELKAALSNG